MVKTDELKYSRKNVWEQAGEAAIQEIMAFAEDYKSFISNTKTERTCVRQIFNTALANGFISIEQCQTLQPGDRV